MTTRHSIAVSLAALFLAGAGENAGAAGASPTQVEPVDYVRVCDAYGSGFFYVPGTQTCLRISGRVRAEYRVRGFGDMASAWDDRTDNSTQTRARGYARFDSRSDTEYGLLRTYVEAFLTADSGATATTTVGIDHAFISLGGFTIGKTQSVWDYWTGYAYGAIFTDYSNTKLWSVSYTGELADGLSATLAIEDNSKRRTNLVQLGAPATVIASGGPRMPDIVARLKHDGDWGGAQAMGALHQVMFAAGPGKTRIGYALGAGVEVKLPVIGPKDRLMLQAIYTHGASRYAVDSWDGRISDAITDGARTKLTTTWNLVAGLRHEFNAHWAANLEGGWHKVDALGQAYDFRQIGVNGNIEWRPVAGLAIGLEGEFRNVDYRAAGLADGNQFVTLVRVQRDF
ncbi:porin [Stappia sp. ICDLI1TA098]